MSEQVSLFQAPIEIERIMQVLPQRYPYLLVDRVLEMEPGVSAVGLKNVTINEEFFLGHFPTEPIMPGVLIVEGVGQTAALILAAKYGPEEARQKIVSMQDVKFRIKVKPGDQLLLKTTVLEREGDKTLIKFVAEVDGTSVSEGRVTLRRK